MPETSALDALFPVAAELADRLAREGLARLRPVVGVPAAVVMRWCWRHIVQEKGWFPLVEFAAGEPSLVADTARQATGGWLWWTGQDEALRGRLLAATRGLVGLIEPGDGQALALPPAAQDELGRLDAHHEVAADPALIALREGLRAHVRSRRLVALTGPPGSAAARLCRWLHAVDGDGPLHEAAREDGLPPLPRWVLFEEPAELPAEQGRALAARIEALETPVSPWGQLDTFEDVRPQIQAFDAILGQSRALCEVLRRAVQVASHPRSVLITGASGTGKEGLASALHRASGRAGPFLAVDLGAVPEDLLESELFGHARGAFTGADKLRLGAFRAASGGTLFLDEVGNLGLRAQARLLRVLQEREVRPVGEDRPVPVDVRVIAATNADLEAMVAEGEFREDLLRRLGAFTLRLPPLRERGADVLRLARAFFARETGQRLPEPWITPAAAGWLQRWPWPGNVRELENVIANAATRCAPGDALDTPHLAEIDPERRRPGPTLVCWTEPGGPLDLPRGALAVLRGATLRVPPLRERSPAHLRAHLRQRLGALPVAGAALDALARRAWWGEEAELDATVALLRADGRPVTLDRLRRLLPGQDARPIRVLLFPSAGPDGDVRGLKEDYHAPVLIIGRVADARQAERVLARLPGGPEALRRVSSGGTPAVLDLSLQPAVSRVHLALRPTPEGLEIEVFPWAKLGIEAVLLEEAESTVIIPPGGRAALGDAAELCLRSAEGAPLLRFWVFLGALAWDEHAPRALERTRGEAGATLGLAPVAPPIAPEEPATLRRWPLDARETAALVGLIVEFPGGEFKSWVLDRVASWRDPELARLAAFLRAAPKLADYVGRLVDFAPNRHVGVALREAIRSAADVGLLERLPARVQRAVG